MKNSRSFLFNGHWDFPYLFNPPYWSCFNSKWTCFKEASVPNSIFSFLESLILLLSKQKRWGKEETFLESIMYFWLPAHFIFVCLSCVCSSRSSVVFSHEQWWMSTYCMYYVKCDFISPILKITQPFKHKMDSVTKLSTSNKCFMRNISLAFQHQRKDAEIKRTYNKI